MKCLEKIGMSHVKNSTDVTVDLYQYDAISSVVHTALKHLENKECYLYVLLLDFTAFDTTYRLQCKNSQH